KDRRAPTVRPMPEGSMPPAVPLQYAAAPAGASAAFPTRTATVQVWAIGDSVMLGASYELHNAVRDMDVDAQVGRQVSAALKLVRERKDTHRLPPVVIIHLGNNGTFSAQQF